MRNRRRKNRNRPFGRGWRETELDDEGEPLADLPPVRCPRCNRLTDLGGLDDTDVHRCAFCRTRTRWLWCRWEQAVVPDLREPYCELDSIPVEFLWNDYNPDDGWEGDEEDEWRGSRCVNGCEDPVFGGPVPEIEQGGRWACAMCGCRSGEEDDGEEEDSGDGVE